MRDSPLSYGKAPKLLSEWLSLWKSQAACGLPSGRGGRLGSPTRLLALVQALEGQSPAWHSLKCTGKALCPQILPTPDIPPPQCQSCREKHRPSRTSLKIRFPEVEVTCVSQIAVQSKGILSVQRRYGWRASKTEERERQEWEHVPGQRRFLGRRSLQANRQSCGLSGCTLVTD